MFCQSFPRFFGPGDDDRPSSVRRQGPSFKQEDGRYKMMHFSDQKQQVICQFYIISIIIIIIIIIIIFFTFSFF